MQWSIDVAAGHDDQILAEPEQLGVVRPVSEMFLNATSRLLLRLDGFGPSDRLDLTAGFTGVAYGSKIDGEDGEVRLAAAYRRRLAENWTLEGSGYGSRYRRGVSTEGDLFDADRVRVEARLGWAVSPHWLLTGGIQHHWFTYPGRVFGEDATSENQGQVNLALGAVRGLGERAYVAGEATYRFTRSNFDPAEYEGPGLLFRSRVGLPLGFHLATFLSYLERRYDHFGEIDTLGNRSDRSWQAGATLGRSIAPHVSVFLEGSYLDQNSTSGVFEFNQSRIAFGVALDIKTGPSVTGPSPGPPAPLVPQITAEGVRFRYRDPMAKSVSVVGGWNGWRVGADPLQGPDPRGVWQTTLGLEPGIWRYAFVVDGRWMPPPDAPRYEDDGFGGVHGVVQVPVG